MNEIKQKFRLIQDRKLFGWYNEYPYKTVGELINYIYAYSGLLRIAEQIVIGVGYVQWGDSQLATYTYDDQLKMPIFVFNEDISTCDLMKENQDIYLKGQREEIEI